MIGLNSSAWQYMTALGDDLQHHCPALGKLDVFPFSARADKQGHTHGRWVHFFIDDERFSPIWNNPMRYAKRFQSMQLAGLVGFDFSLYDDWPSAVNFYNQWRNAALSHLYRELLEVPVLPVASWDSYSADWSHAYIAPGSAVAIGSYPIAGGHQAGYMAGMNNLMKQINPCELHVFGNLPPNIQCAVPVHQYDLHYQILNQRSA